MEIKNHLFNKIRFLESPNFNNRPLKEEIRLIIIHSISLPPNTYGNTYVEDFFLNKLDVSEHDYFNEIKDLRVSSHIYIKRDGEIIQFVPFNKRAWHAGESSYMGVPDCNDYAIGIELEGSDDDFFSDEQYNSLIVATQEILKEYPMIKKDNITGHSNVAPKRKVDPGKNFEWEKYLSSL